MGCRPSKADFLSAKFGEDNAYYGDRSEGLDHDDLVQDRKHGHHGHDGDYSDNAREGSCYGHGNEGSYDVPYSANTKRTLSHSSSEFSTVTTISGRSKIRVTLSSDGSMIEVEKYEPWDAFPSPVPGVRANVKGGLDNAGFRSDSSDTDQSFVSPSGSRVKNKRDKPPPKMHSMPNLRLSLLGDHSGNQSSRLPKLEKKKNHAQFFSRRHEKNSKLSALKHSKTEGNVPYFNSDKACDIDIRGISRTRSPKYGSGDLLGENVVDSSLKQSECTNSHGEFKLPDIKHSVSCDRSVASVGSKDGPGQCSNDCSPKTLVVDLHNPCNPSDVLSNSTLYASDVYNGNVSTADLGNVGGDGLDIRVNAKSPNLSKVVRKASSAGAGKKKTGRLFRKTKSDLSSKSIATNDGTKKSDFDAKKNATHSENSSMDISSDFEDDLAVAMMKNSDESKLEFDLANIRVHQDFFNDFGDDFNDDDFMNS